MTPEAFMAQVSTVVSSLAGVLISVVAVSLVLRVVTRIIGWFEGTVR